MKLVLPKPITVVTVGRFCATICEIQRIPEPRYHGTVQVVGTGRSLNCAWDESGACTLGAPQFDIDLTAPIGYVLRWHLNNTR